MNDIEGPRFGKTEMRTAFILRKASEAALNETALLMPAFDGLDKSHMQSIWFPLWRAGRASAAPVKPDPQPRRKRPDPAKLLARCKARRKP